MQHKAYSLQSNESVNEIKIAELSDFILDELSTKLPPNLTYHNRRHTEYVIKTACFIADQENMSTKEKLLIRTAAIMHDTGFLFTYSEHEVVSCTYSRQVLPDYGYSEDDIEEICTMIMATRIPQSPVNKCSEILADADLEYLGTDRFEQTGFKLFLELKSRNPAFDEDQWNKIQIKFMSAHQYFTPFCKENREETKLLQLQKLKEMA
ncbi:MAG: HD domain-containing protein [Saprospiraceae bacterium]|jgi:uncharacterized protein|nr:HD domain-containing protein [Saprospiraceae bacterium]MBL0025895.1 HD domain-containing protein [Saprospiraceae bacterium]